MTVAEPIVKTSAAVKEFIEDFGRFFGIPIKELTDPPGNMSIERTEYKLKVAKGYILEYGENGSRIQTAHQEYGFMWPNHWIKDRNMQMKHVEDAYYYIRRFFPGHVCHVKINPTWIDQFFDLFDEGVCNVLSVGTSSHMYSDRELEGTPDCSKRDMLRLLNRIKVLKGLSLNGPKVLKTEHPTFNAVSWLKVANGQWMTKTHLNRLQNKCIDLSDVIFTDRDVNEYLQKFRKLKWNPVLHVMTLTKKQYGKEEKLWNEQEVLEGFNVQHVKKQEYPLWGFDPDIFPFANFLPLATGDSIHISNAHQFRRKDGVRVTVEVRGNELRVFVWHPDVYKSFSRKQRKAQRSKGEASQKEESEEAEEEESEEGETKEIKKEVEESDLTAGEKESERDESEFKICKEEEESGEEYENDENDPEYL